MFSEAMFSEAMLAEAMLGPDAFLVRSWQVLAFSSEYERLWVAFDGVR